MSTRIEKFSLRTGEILATYDKLIHVRRDGFSTSGVSRCINGHTANYQGYGWRATDLHGLKWSAVRGRCYLLVDGFKEEVQTFNNRSHRRLAIDILRDSAKKFRKHKTEILIQLDL